MDIQKDMIFLNVYFRKLELDDCKQWNNILIYWYILIHNINNIQLVILFPILPQLTNCKSVLETTTKTLTNKWRYIGKSIIDLKTIKDKIMIKKIQWHLSWYYDSKANNHVQAMEACDVTSVDFYPSSEVVKSSL